MADLRTFVAVELPDRVREDLHRWVDPQKRDLPGVRWVRSSGLHVTLTFLGDLAEALVPRVVRAVQEVSEGLRPFTLKLSGVSGFPRPDRARVIWVGVEGELNSLFALKEGVEGALEPLGCAPERGKLHPHVTLGRSSRRPVSLLGTFRPLPGGKTFGVERVSVMKSELHPDGARYTALGRGELRA
jgi:2'-5' RNA ligase